MGRYIAERSYPGWQVRCLIAGVFHFHCQTYDIDYARRIARLLNADEKRKGRPKTRICGCHAMICGHTYPFECRCQRPCLMAPDKKRKAKARRRK